MGALPSSTLKSGVGRNAKDPVESPNSTIVRSIELPGDACRAALASILHPNIEIDYHNQFSPLLVHPR